jgi:hypothetical protein
MVKTRQNLFEILGEVVYQRINGREWCVDPYKRVHTDLSQFKEAYQIYKDTILPSYNKPFVYYHSMANNYGFDSLRYDNDTINYCNEHGLEIFFSELMTNSVGDRFNFYPTFLINIDETAPRIIMEWENDKNKNMHCFELDGVRRFIQRNKLTNVTLCIGVKDKFEIYKKIYPDLNIVYKDVFLQSIVGQLIKYKTPKNKIDSSSIEYNFWCGNLRYMTYRHVIAAYLQNYNSRVSFGHKGSWKKLVDNIWFDIEQWKTTEIDAYNKIKNGVKLLNSSTQWIDKKFEHSVPITGTVEDYLNYPNYPQDLSEPIYYSHCQPELYAKTFCAVVTESIFAQPVATVSEKPFNAIHNQRPFIVVGTPCTLELLHDMGFKTFGDYWDESYDVELDHEKRLTKILKIIDKIGNMSVQECRDMYEDMRSILEHNYNNINKNLFDTVLHLV